MLSSTLIFLASAALTAAHIVITYPGWRGNNLITNETFPYGMQWMYPCGGTRLTQNRTYWSVKGGAVALQPGWFQGHDSATIYVNLGIGNEAPDGGPLNMSLAMAPPFGIVGPSKNPYPGTICLPQVPLPKNVNVKAGDSATIQVVELALHGAALYSCVDITFVETDDPRLGKVNESNCFNSSDISFTDIYATPAKTTNLTATSGAQGGSVLAWSAYGTLGWLPLVAGALWTLV
ncbi:hypothetical protein GGTG_14029 [Gaeumannomyces tritici R3-111a-1]|uniref:Copper acquisition factor BIM1-like domain-containing protein n=1 Tax=Gaeumannomyces tritici (strain R3-111a-1) TaxID=644352 RepID=J3PKH3_GAET3|nr:hypothetical protein GGTG_14029 [Gaeumannomyces tritici R3-111a-1]EJT68391.1 hypothetical protein GGTG_14029 [Gaeumannomyces tritici R3-111a-1]